MTMCRLNVRCCCQPTKVLGTYPIPEGARSYCVAVRDNGRIRKEVLEVRAIAHPSSIIEMAIYSEDRPIEFWRKLPGFVEAA